MVVLILASLPYGKQGMTSGGAPTKVDNKSKHVREDEKEQKRDVRNIKTRRSR